MAFCWLETCYQICLPSSFQIHMQYLPLLQIGHSGKAITNVAMRYWIYSTGFTSNDKKQFKGFTLIIAWQLLKVFSERWK